MLFFVNLESDPKEYDTFVIWILSPGYVSLPILIMCQVVLGIGEIWL